MIGKASELQFVQITKYATFSFNVEDHSKAKTLTQLLREWMSRHPDCIVLSIQFQVESGREHALIIYKEAETA